MTGIIFKTVFDTLPIPPKKGNGKTGTALGSKYCKNLCHRFKSKRPYRIPYSTHYYCTRCNFWGNKETLIGNMRCPCCNYHPRMKTWFNKKAMRERNERRLKV
jgi:hypothetical protein